MFYRLSLISLMKRLGSAGLSREQSVATVRAKDTTPDRRVPSAELRGGMLVWVWGAECVGV